MSYCRKLNFSVYFNTLANSLLKVLVFELHHVQLLFQLHAMHRLQVYCKGANFRVGKIFAIFAVVNISAKLKSRENFCETVRSRRWAWLPGSNVLCKIALMFLLINQTQPNANVICRNRGYSDNFV